MRKLLRIGTRKSQLARWQAEYIASLLKEQGINSELILIHSDGEVDVETPLYELGISGIFTKTLDAALLNDRIDIAVHSLKDVPTILAKGLVIAGIPKRANPFDVLVYKEDLPDMKEDYCIATSSIRRKAQWLNRYPTHQVVSIRGNINTRVNKLKEEENLDATILALAGLERIGLETPNRHVLEWMIPAPSQGALAIVCKESDGAIMNMMSMLHHDATRKAVEAERQFLRRLEGGCSAPIASHAEVINKELFFKGAIFSPDGKDKAMIEKSYPINETEAGIKAANLIFDQYGEDIISTYRINRS